MRGTKDEEWMEVDSAEKVEITKKKKALLLVIAFLLSFVAQFIYIQIDYVKILQKNEVAVVDVSSVEHMVVEEGVYFGTENVASIFFEGDGYFVTEIIFELSQDYGYERGWLLYCATNGQEFQLKDAVNFTTEVEQKWMKISIPPDQYDTFRLDMFFSQEAPLYLEHIYLSQEPITLIDELFSKVSFGTTIVFTSMIFVAGILLLSDITKAKVYAPFVVLFLYYAYYFPNKPLSGDVIGMFTTQSEGVSLFTFCLYRYENWSSRLVIEGFLYYLIHHNWLWGILTAFLCLLICVSMSRLLSKRTATIHWVIVGLFFLLPMSTMGEAGWMAATTNYLWVLAFGIFSLLSVKDSLDGKELSQKQVILYSLATIYGANQEQGAALLLGFYLLFFCYFKYIKIPTKVLVPHLLITVISLAIHLICPGNSIRSDITKTVEFPEFEQLSLFTKVEMAYTSSLYEFVMESNSVSVLFCVIFLLLAFVKKDKKSIGCFVVPLSIYCIFNHFSEVLSPVLPWIVGVKEAMTETGTNPSFLDFVSVLPIMIVTLWFGFLLLGLYFISGNKMLGLLQVMIMLAGLASRMIMGASPSIWLSGERTFIFMYFCVIVTGLYGYVALECTNHKKSLKAVHILLAINVVDGFLKLY